MGRADTLEKALMLGKIEGRRKRGHQSMRWLGSIDNSVGMNLSKLCVIVEIKEAWHAACPWGGKGLDMTEWLNEVIHIVVNQTIKTYSKRQLS